MIKYNILMIHYKIQGTDGVSLEMNKWKKTFEKLGHNVFMLGAEVGNDSKIIYPPLHHTSQLAKRLYNYSFVNKNDFKDDNEYKTTIIEEANKCEKIIEEYVVKNNINLIIPQNIWSVAMNPAVAIAVEKIVEKFSLKVLAQHHDFYWERIGGVNFGCDFAREISKKYIPPTNKDYTHVVINKQGQDTLYNKKQLKSTIVPNVFDFNGKPWEKDEYNKDFRQKLNIKENDIVFLQATRIVERKGIELAIDLISKLNNRKESLINKRLYDNRIITKETSFKLVLAGYSSDDNTGTYQNRLINRAEEKNVELLFISDFISHEREIVDNIKKYSLWDTYVHSDIITYPSYWEGWGNQLLEGLFAKVPIALYEYPVFISDIKDKGFDYINLGSSHKKINNLIQIEDEILERAANQTIEYLLNKEKREKCVNKNFEIGKKYYSLETLEYYLSSLLNKL